MTEYFHTFGITKEQFERFNAIAPDDPVERRAFLDHFIESALSTAEMIARIVNFTEITQATTVLPVVVPVEETPINPPKTVNKTERQWDHEESHEIRKGISTLIDSKLIGIESTEDIIARLDQVIATVRGNSPAGDKKA